MSADPPAPDHGGHFSGLAARYGELPELVGSVKVIAGVPAWRREL